MSTNIEIRHPNYYSLVCYYYSETEVCCVSIGYLHCITYNWRNHSVILSLLSPY